MALDSRRHCRFHVLQKRLRERPRPRRLNDILVQHPQLSKLFFALFLGKPAEVVPNLEKDGSQEGVTRAGGERPVRDAPDVLSVVGVELPVILDGLAVGFDAHNDLSGGGDGAVGGPGGNGKVTGCIEVGVELDTIYNVSLVPS